VNSLSEQITGFLQSIQRLIALIRPKKKAHGAWRGNAKRQNRYVPPLSCSTG